MKQSDTHAAKRERVQDCQPHDCIADILVRQNEGLRHEVDMLTNAGVIECMVRNKSVNERISSLERELSEVTREREALAGIKATLQHYAGPGCGDPSDDQLLSWMLATVYELGGAMRSYRVAYEDRDKRLVAAERELDELRGKLEEAQALLARHADAPMSDWSKSNQAIIDYVRDLATPPEK